MSDNWVVQNLTNSLDTWNEKLGEVWTLLTQSPQAFKGGAVWSVIVNIYGTLQAIGYALLVLFFVAGVIKTCGSFAEVKRPEHALRLFFRFALSKAAITYGMDLMLALLEIVQGIISDIMQSSGIANPEGTVLPSEIVSAVEECGFFESIPLWAVTLIGGLIIWVLSFIMILSVYGRFFKIYIYTAIAPIPMYYGVNAISHNLILCNKQNLMNQSSFLLGIPGSGKSFTAKLNILLLLLGTKDDIFICDPEGEYGPLIRAMGDMGSVIHISAGGKDRLNAMYMVDGYGENNPVVVKSQFIMSLVEQIDKKGVGPQHKSIIDRCVASVYREAEIILYIRLFELSERQ